MMRLAEAGDIHALKVLCGHSLLGTYVLSRYCAYGNNYAFARCYVDRTDGRIRTALSILDGNAVLVTTASTDFVELAAVLPMLPLQTLMTDAAAMKELPFPVVRKKQAFCCMNSVSPAPADADAPLREVYRLISRAIPHAFPSGENAYLHFLSDFTFRRTRGLARLKVISQQDIVCACALTAAEGPSSAVISGVACLDTCRGQGFGRRVVAALTHELQQENKTVYVIALNDDAGSFYRHLGFSASETVFWLKL